MKNKIEELRPDLLKEQLLSRKNALEVVLAVKKVQLKSAPEGKLRITSSNGCIQYYNQAEGFSKNGKYIPKSAHKLALQLAQKEYNLKLIQEIEMQIKCISAAIAGLEHHNCNAVYSMLNSKRQALIEPVTLSDEEYIRRWGQVPYSKKGFSSDASELFTAKGERVRSKSEIIIADTLGHLGIPYRYEFPLQLKRYTVHPDFYCLNVSSRQEFAWEHFGMMDNADYASKAVEKLVAYEAAGYFPGKNLIITMETVSSPISSRQINLIAEQYLM